MATPDQTTIFISSTIFFQSKFAGLLKLPLEIKVKKDKKKYNKHLKIKNEDIEQDF